MKRILSRVSVAVFLALALFIVTTLALPAMPSQAASDPECWAVLVGISNYQYLNDLDYCDDDARELSEELSPVWGSSHVKLVRDSSATKAGILAVIDWLADNADADDTVLFAFSGHGASGGYLCPYNSLTYSYSNDISTAELANAFQAVNAKKIVVILDICHAGAFQNALSENGRVIMMACRSSELSEESGSLRNGVYSYYIIKAFNNFDSVDTNDDYELSAEEIALYANPLATDYNSSQHPVLDDHYTGGLALLAKFVYESNISLPANMNVLTVDGTSYKYSSVPSSILWVPDTSHTIEVPELVSVGIGSRCVFTRWSDGSVSVTRTITKGSFTANYEREFLLEVISDWGEAQGGGWYREDTSAGFSVTDFVEMGGARHYFTGWSGDYWGTSPSASIVMDEPQIVTADWRHEYLLTLNSEYGTLTGAGWYGEGETATFSVTDYVELPDTRHYFTRWSGAYSGDSPSGSLLMDVPKQVTANWRHEYLLTLNSDYGEPTGAGWYKEGETASVSVEPVQGFIVRHVFDGWSGDLTDTAAASSVTMNSPRVVTAMWHTDLVQLYILIGGVVVVAGAVITTVVLVRRRRRMA